MEQKTLAQLSGVSLPTIQRMEASNGIVRGVIDSLMKVMAGLEAAGVEFINEGATSSGGGRGCVCASAKSSCACRKLNPATRLHSARVLLALRGSFRNNRRSNRSGRRDGLAEDDARDFIEPDERPILLDRGHGVGERHGCPSNRADLAARLRRRSGR